MRVLAILLFVVGLAGCDPSTLLERGGDEVIADPGDCSVEVRDDLAAVIDAQLEAFTRGEWEEALDLASTGFRRQFDAARFRAVIEGEFPIVAEHEAREFGPCLVGDVDDARILVTVTDDGATQALTYLMVLENESWRIGGAVPLDRGPSDDGPLI